MGFNQSQGHIWFQDREWKSNKLLVIHNFGQIAYFTENSAHCYCCSNFYPQHSTW